MPLAQSLSPALYAWGFARSSHPGVYLAWEKSAEDLPGFFAAMRSLPIAGLSVTIPHKQAVIPFLDELTPRAQAVGAVNLVYWQEGGLVGDNTDVAGFLAPLLKLRDAGKKLPPRAVLLGAGGAGRAVLAGLREFGEELGLAEVWVAARSAAKAEALVQDFDCQSLDWEDREQALTNLGPTLIINATPLGMAGSNAGQSPLPGLAQTGLSSCPNASGSDAWFIYDIVYNPMHTPLLTAGQERGMTCIDGLDFFVAQAKEQFRIWTGAELPGRETRALLLGILEKQSDGRF
jgi:shikimate dehydrogenase